MGILYIDRQGMELRLSGGALEVRDDAGHLRSVPARLLERVVLRADTKLTSGVLAGLADMGVGVLALGGRGGQRVAHMVGAPAADVRVRIAQCQRLADDAFAGAWTRRILIAKVSAQRRLLLRALAQRPDVRKPITDGLSTVDLSLARIRTELDRTVLRGLEGSAAAAYWKAFAALLPEGAGFVGRRRRPPPDPVNVALSLGYTLLHAQAVHACWAAGLDPMVGYLHLPLRGRASLACDLMEPWRPHVDDWVWKQFRERTLRPEHFGQDGAGACLLGKAGRNRFYGAWAGVQQRSGRALLRHARIVARTLSAGVQLPAVDESEFEETIDPGDSE